jgi:hypothetical protein
MHPLLATVLMISAFISSADQSPPAAAAERVDPEDAMLQHIRRFGCNHTVGMIWPIVFTVADKR